MKKTLLISFISMILAFQTVQAHPHKSGGNDKKPWSLEKTFEGAKELPAEMGRGNLIYCGVGKMVVYKGDGDFVQTDSACPQKVYFITRDGVLAQFGNGLWFTSFDGSEKRITSATPEKILCINRREGSWIAEYGNGTWVQTIEGKESRISSAKATTVHGCTEAGMLAEFGNGLWIMKFDGSETRLTSAKPNVIYGQNEKGILACYGNGLWFQDWQGKETRLSNVCPRKIYTFTAEKMVGCWGNGVWENNLQGNEKRLARECPPEIGEN